MFFLFSLVYLHEHSIFFFSSTWYIIFDILHQWYVQYQFKLIPIWIIQRFLLLTYRMTHISAPNRRSKNTEQELFSFLRYKYNYNIKDHFPLLPFHIWYSNNTPSRQLHASSKISKMYPIRNSFLILHIQLILNEDFDPLQQWVVLYSSRKKKHTSFVIPF